MKKIGLLFPGQGSQAVGMGRELYNSIPEAKRIMDLAVEKLDYDIKSLIFDGNEDELRLTENAQLAIFIVSAMYLEKFKLMREPFEVAAGHSIGEYAALYACGVFGFDEALHLVRQRGLAMSKANHEGTMFAVLGMDLSELNKYVEETNGKTVIANINAKTQIVISGYVYDTERLVDKLSTIDGVKVKKLNVSSAFHSPMMEEAQNIMAKEIDGVEFKEPGAYVIPNLTAEATKDVAELKRCLKCQITGRVNWLNTILIMKKMDIEKLYEIGYGDVLKKLNKSITMRLKCTGMDEV